MTGQGRKGVRHPSTPAFSPNRPGRERPAALVAEERSRSFWGGSAQQLRPARRHAFAALIGSQTAPRLQPALRLGLEAGRLRLEARSNFQLCSFPELEFRLCPPKIEGSQRSGTQEAHRRHAGTHPARTQAVAAVGSKLRIVRTQVSPTFTGPCRAQRPSRVESAVPACLPTACPSCLNESWQQCLMAHEGEGHVEHSEHRGPTEAAEEDGRESGSPDTRPMDEADANEEEDAPTPEATGAAPATDTGGRSQRRRVLPMVDLNSLRGQRSCLKKQLRDLTRTVRAQSRRRAGC